MRIIKRTKITVIRTETVFLKMQDATESEYARALLEIKAAELAANGVEKAPEIEVNGQDTDNQGEVK